MKLIIAGTREFKDFKLLQREVLRFLEESGHDIYDVTIISGGARGADRLGELFADFFSIPCIIMEADWEANGRSAGFIRNKEMAKIADACICFWDGHSRGTKHMIDIAREFKLNTRVINYVE